jgi:murein DD-endopeptidase MepM/ murein hydrolase activator NlpD
VRIELPETRFSHAAHRRIGLLGAIAALAVASLGTGVASAQTGGSTAPGSTAPAPTTPTTTTPSGYSQVFPIPPSVRHTFGGGFGTSRGKRSHQGQDVFAACNSMLIAVSNSRVVKTGFHRAAGNYLVLRNKAARQDYVYMHLAYRAPVAKGSIITVGQFVGAVGQTGNARGCHLHFELWQGKYYRGGKPIDPLSTLQYWDSYS